MKMNNNIAAFLLVVLISMGIVQFAQWRNNKPIDSTYEHYAPIVSTNSGKVRGLVRQLDNGDKLNFYQGIPYGQAGRFAKPQPIPPWTDVYDAVVSRSSCPQLFLQIPMAKLAQSEHMSEDCLYLNIWVPVKAPKDNNQKRAVMFYVHGGGYAIGTIFSSMTEAAAGIASEGDVIVVLVNYRFLQGGDVKGNFGLLDQILGLKWTHDNIHLFGGDPERITIIGGSAGSMAVGTLVISPLANGLFRRAILQGGGPNSQMGAISPKEGEEKTRILAAKLGCQKEQIQEAVDCLRKVSMKKLANAPSFEWAKNEFFVPVYGDDEVLPISPVEALKTGQLNQEVDIMFGVTRDEGSTFVTEIIPDLLKEPANLTVDSTRKHIEYIMNDIYKQRNGAEVAKFYTEKLANPTDDDFRIAIAQAWGDFYLICPTILFGEHVAAHAPHNRYYSYRMMQYIPSAWPGYRKWMGVIHGQDSFYVLKVQPLSRPQDKQMSKDFTQALVAFAKTGNPGSMASVEWEEAFDRNNLKNGSPSTRYMSLNVDDYKMVDGFYREKCDRFWKQRINP